MVFQLLKFEVLCSLLRQVLGAAVKHMIDLKERHKPISINDEIATIISWSSVGLKYYNHSTRQFFSIFI